MKYGKIVDGTLIIHNRTNPIIGENGSLIVSSNPEFLMSHGYKRIIESVPEFREGYYVSSFELVEDDVSITKKWLYEQIVVDDSPTIDEQIADLQTNTDNMQTDIDMLTECILEMSSILYA